jgi:hypothetical protein
MLCIDVGIKNLAICIANKEGISHWNIVNLSNLEEKHEECTICKKPAKWKTPQGLVCGIHLSKKAIFIEKKVKPTVSQLKAFLESNQLDTKGKRDELMERCATIATLPVDKKKNMNTFASNTVHVHDAIRNWILRDWSYLSTVSHVCIEHQPVYKNPVMKTVQMLLFCSLRDHFLQNGKNIPFQFVHAGKKSKGQTVGDEGYKDRKKEGIRRATAYLESFSEDHPQRSWLTFLKGHSKKDDLCDTLCMVLDQLHL